METLQQTIAANKADALALSHGVRIWMTVMSVSFASSVIFALVKSGARWILFGLVTNIAALILVRMAFSELSRTQIGTVAHLVFWTFALFMIWRPSAIAARKEIKPSAYNAAYSVWLPVVSAIMTISLVLDMRTLIQWLV